MKIYIKKIPPVIRVLIPIILLLLLIGIISVGKIQYEKFLMKPLKTGKVISDIYAIKDGSVNFYLIKGDKGYIMIDSGKSKRKFNENLEKIKISPEEIQAVLLTHSDEDHVAGVSLLNNAQTYLPQLERKMIDSSTKRGFIGGKNKLESTFKPLEDGETLNISGISIKCLSTPGHTLGSMSYLINDKYLFVGDSMSLKDGKVELFNSIFNMDNKEQEKSLKKLANIKDVNYVFTDHYGYTSNTVDAFKKWK